MSLQRTIARQELRRASQAALRAIVASSPASREVANFDTVTGHHHCSSRIMRMPSDRFFARYWYTKKQWARKCRKLARKEARATRLSTGASTLLGFDWAYYEVGQ